MKKVSKRMSAMLFVLVALFIMFPAVSAQARPLTESLIGTKKMTLTLYNKKDVLLGTGKTKMNTQTLGYVIGKVKNLKSSNKSVLTVSKKETPFINGKTWTNVAANVKKTGTATVSFKVNAKTYKIKVTVKKYQNPISSIKIGNTTIKGSKFKSTSNYSLKYSKFAGKNTKVTVKLAKGWKFYYHRPELSVYPKANAKIINLANGKKIKVKGKKGYTINITVYQKSTGRVEDISVILK